MKEYYLRDMPHVVEDKYNKVIEKTITTQFFQDRTVFLNGEITADYANQVVSQLIYLAKTSEAEINIFINSNGGEVNAGLLIYDVIQSIKSPVNVYCTGRAASMVAALLAGGQKGRRYILPHSELLIHEPLLAGGVGGSISPLEQSTRKEPPISSISFLFLMV